MSDKDTTSGDSMLAHFGHNEGSLAERLIVGITVSSAQAVARWLWKLWRNRSAGQPSRRTGRPLNIRPVDTRPTGKQGPRRKRKKRR
ncbi:hypothetical protein ACWDD9_20225 [Kitasatospora sp. NPDC001119]